MDRTLPKPVPVGNGKEAIGWDWSTDGTGDSSSYDPETGTVRQFRYVTQPIAAPVQSPAAAPKPTSTTSTQQTKAPKKAVSSPAAGGPAAPAVTTGVLTPAPPPTPGGTGGGDMGSRADMPGGADPNAPSGAALGSGNGGDGTAGNYKFGGLSGLNPRLGTAPMRNSMNALATMGRIY